MSPIDRSGPVQGPVRSGPRLVPQATTPATRHAVRAYASAQPRAASRAEPRIPAPLAPPPGGDVEVSVRVFADGGSVTVVRRTVGDRTVGIDALIR